jgi:hypothetical protein
LKSILSIGKLLECRWRSKGVKTLWIEEFFIAIESSWNVDGDWRGSKLLGLKSFL